MIQNSRFHKQVSVVLAYLVAGIAIALVATPIRVVKPVQLSASGWSKKPVEVPKNIIARGPMDVTLDSGEGIGLEVALPVDGVGRWMPKSLNFDAAQWRIKDELSDRIVSLVPHAQLHLTGEYVSSFSMGLISETSQTHVTLTSLEAKSHPLIVKVKPDGKFRNASFTPPSGFETTTLPIWKIAQKQSLIGTSEVWWGSYRLTSDNNFPINQFALNFIKLVGILLATLLFSLVAGIALTRLLGESNRPLGLVLLSGFLSVLLTAGALNYFVTGQVVAWLSFAGLVGLATYFVIRRNGRIELLDSLKNLDIQSSGLSFIFLGAAASFVTIYKGWTVGLAQTDVFDYYYGIHSGLNNSYFSGNIVTGNGMRSLDFASRSLWGNFLPDMLSISIWAISTLFIGSLAIADQARKALSKSTAWIAPGLLLASGSLTGLWTEAYLSRWFVAVAALIACLLLVSTVLAGDSISRLFIFTLLGLSAAQLAIVPVFIAVPFGVVLSLIYLWNKQVGSEKRFSLQPLLSDAVVRKIIAIVAGVGLINVLWFRNFKTTLALASDQLDGIVKWIVIPFYKTPRFGGTLSGLLPWHAIPESRWGIPTSAPGNTIYNFITHPTELIFLSWKRLLAVLLVVAVVTVWLFVSRGLEKSQRWNAIFSFGLVLCIAGQGVLNVKLSSRSLYAFLMYFVTLAPAFVATLLFILIYLALQLHKKSKYVGALPAFLIAVVVVLNGSTSAIEVSRWNDSAQHILSVNAIGEGAKAEGFTSVQIAKVEPMTDYEFVYLSNVMTAELQDAGIACANCVQQENRISSVNPIVGNSGNPNVGTLFIGGKCATNFAEVTRYQWFTLCK